MVLRRGRGKPPTSKPRMVAVIDYWENDAVAGTYVTAPQASAAIRQVGPKARDGPWRLHIAAGQARDGEFLIMSARRS
jgi:hypothetical protein